MNLQKIPFNIPPQSKNEQQYVLEVIKNRKLSGNGDFSQRCVKWLKENLQCELAVITPSCTSALEMAMLLADVGHRDEVIVPSFTFTSTATAPLLYGAVPVFVDISPATMNIDVASIERAITAKTKVIMPMHYAGVCCDMESIMKLAEKHNLIVVADAAQSIHSSYLGKPTAAWGHMAALSFHETKNIVCGEGGALIINDSRFKARAEIVRDKGTDRQQFINGQVDKYRWMDKGSSFLLSELASAFLFSQLEEAPKITKKRLANWSIYHQKLQRIDKITKIELMHVPDGCEHNGHIYFIKLPDEKVCNLLLKHLVQLGIQATTHYVPLHSSPAGLKFGKSYETLNVTEDLAYRILRLPMYADLVEDQIEYIVSAIEFFFKEFR